MGRFAVLEDGVVTNVIEAEPEFAELIGAIPAPTAAIGDLYQDGVFIRPPAPVLSNDERRAAAKARRQAAVDAIQVTSSTGKVFDGDEISQGRMSRAIIGMEAAGAPSIRWTLADNTGAEVTSAELTEALILAGQEQARLWDLAQWENES